MTGPLSAAPVRRRPPDRRRCRSPPHPTPPAARRPGPARRQPQPGRRPRRHQGSGGQDWPATTTHPDQRPIAAMPAAAWTESRRLAPNNPPMPTPDPADSGSRGQGGEQRERQRQRRHRLRQPAAQREQELAHHDHADRAGDEGEAPRLVPNPRQIVCTTKPVPAVAATDSSQLTCQADRNGSTDWPATRTR